MFNKIQSLIVILLLLTSIGTANGVDTNEVIMSGTVNPNGPGPLSSTTAWFEWGTSTDYGNTTFPRTSVGSGIIPVPFRFILEGLTCGTTYHWRGAAENTGGMGYGDDRSATLSSDCVSLPLDVLLDFGFEMTG
jgi:hypothetical protein